MLNLFLPAGEAGFGMTIQIMNHDIKLQTCKNTRKIAAASLSRFLKSQNVRDGSLSETKTQQGWLAEIQKSDEIFPEGWYVPPPHGIGVLFGEANRESHINYKHLRLPEIWPRSDITLGGKNEMAYLYASPVDKQTGIIGDFGVMIYLGNNKKIINHLKLCLKINYELLDETEIDMTFKDFYSIAEKKFASYRLTNNIVSTSDPTLTNIGHTIPVTYEDWNAEEQQIMMSAQTSWEEKCKIISKKRKFVNSIEEQQFVKGMAVTLEPRLVDPNNPQIPMSSYHTIMTFHEDGTKELFTCFDEIFKIAGMDYMLP